MNELPIGSLHEFIRDYYDDGIDPVLSAIEMKQENVEVGGIALFKGDRYVATIDPDQSIRFLMLLHSFTNGEVLIKYRSRSMRCCLHSFMSGK